MDLLNLSKSSMRLFSGVLMIWGKEDGDLAFLYGLVNLCKVA